jgi:peptidoglycan/LPS O-acetylase OafA/YrhL
VGFACIVAAAAETLHPPRLLAARPVAWTGQVSYGVYLWHVPLLLYLRAHGLLPLDPIGAFVVVAPVAIAIAALSWYAVERPVQERARRATRTPTRRPATGLTPDLAPGASRAG